MTYLNTQLTTATDLFNAGFKSQADKKRVNDRINSAYSAVRNDIQEAILAARNISECEAESECLSELYWSLPDLHNWKAKHDTMFAAYPEQLAIIARLIEMREATKAATIVKVEKDKIQQKTEEVRQVVISELERKKQRFIEGLELAKHFGGLSVSVNAHYVRNEKGTDFIRHFFYLEGKLTALNMIIAIAEELEK